MRSIVLILTISGIGCLGASPLCAQQQEPAPVKSLTAHGFEITPLSIERTEEWRPGAGFLAMYAKYVRSKNRETLKAKPGFEFAVVRIGMKLTDKQAAHEGRTFPKIQLVDAAGGKHSWPGGNFSPNENWASHSEEFDFEIPTNTPKLVKLLFGELTFDIGNLKRAD